MNNTAVKSGKLIYVIGDLQGCLGPLKDLLNEIQYDPDNMTLWFAGDLINRGPESLETLRFVKQLPADTVVVLGNHDLSLLVLAHKPELPSPSHDFYPILTAPDKVELLDWLRHRPLLHHDSHHHYTLVHAGIYPTWSLTQATQYAHEVEQALQGPDYVDVLANLFGNEPIYWDNNLQGYDRIRFIFNAFTRMRFCKPASGLPLLDLNVKGTPEQHPELIPWVKFPNRIMAPENIIFGHWSALEANQPLNIPHFFPLDSGCVWGNALTAFCLNTQQYTRIPCKPYLQSQHSNRL